MDIVDKLKQRVDRLVRREGGWNISEPLVPGGYPTSHSVLELPAPGAKLTSTKFHNCTWDRKIAITALVTFGYKIRNSEKPLLTVVLGMVNDQMFLYAEFVQRFGHQETETFKLHRLLRNIQTPSSINDLTKFSRRAKREANFGGRTYCSPHDVLEGTLELVDY